MKKLLLFVACSIFYCSFAQLPPNSFGEDFTLTDINGNEFNLHSTLDDGKTVILDLFATWCGPCRMVGPIIDELSNENEGKAIIAKLDVDANQIFAAKYGVRNIPTVLLFKDGEMISRQVGVAPKQTYQDAINSAL